MHECPITVPLALFEGRWLGSVWGELGLGAENGPPLPKRKLPKWTSTADSHGLAGNNIKKVDHFEYGIALPVYV